MGHYADVAAAWTVPVATYGIDRFRFYVGKVINESGG